MARINWKETAIHKGYASLFRMLTEMYIDWSLSSREIGKIFGVSHQTVLNLLRKVRIPVNSRGGSYSDKKKTEKTLLTKRFLREKK